LANGEPATLVKFPVVGSTIPANMLGNAWSDDPAIRYAKLSVGVKLIEARPHTGPNEVLTCVSEPELGSILQIGGPPHSPAPYNARPKGSLATRKPWLGGRVCKDVNEPSFWLTEYMFIVLPEP